MCMISVVMATYNGEKYVIQQMESIRKQTVIPDEVLIVDDASVDNTLNIIEDYIKKYSLNNWKLIKNNDNLGYKRNFYKGISYASGKYIFLSDQDDEWNSRKIECMVEIMEHNPNIWALNCGVELIDSDSHKIEFSKKRNYYNAGFLYSKEPLKYINFFSLSYIAKHNISPGCTMVIAERAKENFMNTYNFELPHDWHLNLIAAANHGCAYVDENMVYYRRHDSNVIGANSGIIDGIIKKSRSVRIDNYKMRIKTLSNILEYYNLEKTEEIESVQILFERMLDFYQKPTPKKLLYIRRMHGYKELAKRKIRIWEIIVAFRIDGMILKILKWRIA